MYLHPRIYVSCVKFHLNHWHKIFNSFNNALGKFINTCRVSLYGLNTHNLHGPRQVQSMWCKFGFETLFYTLPCVKKKTNIFSYLTLVMEFILYVFASNRTQTTHCHLFFGDIDWANLKITYLKNKLNFDKVTFNTLEWIWMSHVN